MRTTVILLLGLAACAAASPVSGYSRRHLTQPSCSFSCADNCAACTGKVSFTDTDGVQKLRVTVNVAGCKGSALSWMCCRGSGSDSTEPTALGCTLEENSPCGGTVEQAINKCNTVISSIYVVPSTATTLTVQTHDGQQAGNVDCGSVDCCGGANSACSGSNGVVSGVCDRVIDLSTCPTGPPVGGGGCTSDAQCATLNGPCGEGKCNAATGNCFASPKTAGTVCRPADGLCDVAESCDGTSTSCPDDGVADGSVVCRPADGLCDMAENCDGTNKACPNDAVVQQGTVCRAANGLCDVTEECDGTSKACPNDAVAQQGTVCRQAAGVCDAEEKCDGQLKTCPTDAKKPSTESCRAAKDKCDLEEFCTGSSDNCPADAVYRDKGKGFKCGRECFFCGAESKAELEQLRNTWALGTCNMGSCDIFTFLPATSPLCTGPVPLTCPNGRGLSNIEHAVCDPATGRFSCVLKQDSPFAGPVSPPW